MGWNNNEIVLWDCKQQNTIGWQAERVGGEVFKQKTVRKKALEGLEARRRSKDKIKVSPLL